MKKLFLFLFTLISVIGLVACNSIDPVVPHVGGEAGTEADAEPNVGEAVSDATDEILIEGCLPFGGLQPMIMVNGKLYTWTGRHTNVYTQNLRVYSGGIMHSVLPDGYTAVGEISGITEEIPSKEFQLRANFDASGTVFTNEQTPEAVYVLITTDTYTDEYIRFASDDLRQNQIITYHGKQYRFHNEHCELIKELPEKCVLIGTLKYIGADVIPVNDLETNRLTDTCGILINGREVYADPDDDSILYVYEHYYWAEGDYPAWRACKVWSEFEND